MMSASSAPTTQIATPTPLIDLPATCTHSLPW